ncbi:DASH family cryptochrome [Flavobacterium coralii]|uniref:DASH family cryptochrome n=1 Tax=Flavobacterium coralii TaxID=2838017 RepID=UPI000C5B5AE0|nr:cryptochrome DASH [Flavobacterium sp.]|tara:strand:- start:50240 stop:51532 length:1293 start_codon:yes stop_codon:yes gene_type:complete
MPVSIVWFKTDLRLHDNEALVRAIQQSDSVVPVFCIDEGQFGTTKFGFKKTGSFRAQFLLESLADLDAQLRQYQSGLVVVKGVPEEELPRLARLYNAKKVYAKKEVTTDEKKQEERVAAALWKQGCVVETFSTSTLYHAEDLPFPLKGIPDVFTTFRKKIEKEAGIRPVFKKPEQIPSPVIAPLELPSLQDLGLEPAVADLRGVLLFKGGETEGLKRLNYYIFEKQGIATYKDTRNGMVGADYSSKFSPWLAMGCLSPREVYHEVKKYEEKFGANKSTYWMIFELLWRDYFRFMMKKHRQRLFLKGGIKNKPVGGGCNPGVIQKWIDGETGQDFIDANMRELKLTGYMSNRGRQNVASYFCHDLGQDWRYGAAYFEEMLIDYDPSSNWGNWAYIAGVGNDPREERQFNPQKQASDYDADMSYRNLWLNNK